MNFGIGLHAGLPPFAAYHLGPMAGRLPGRPPAALLPWAPLAAPLAPPPPAAPPPPGAAAPPAGATARPTPLPWAAKVPRRHVEVAVGAAAAVAYACLMGVGCGLSPLLALPAAVALGAALGLLWLVRRHGAVRRLLLAGGRAPPGAVAALERASSRPQQRRIVHMGLTSFADDEGVRRQFLRGLGGLTATQQVAYAEAGVDALQHLWRPGRAPRVVLLESLAAAAAAPAGLASFGREARADFAHVVALLVNHRVALPPDLAAPFAAGARLPPQDLPAAWGQAPTTHPGACLEALGRLFAGRLWGALDDAQRTDVVACVLRAPGAAAHLVVELDLALARLRGVPNVGAFFRFPRDGQLEAALRRRTTAVALSLGRPTCLAAVLRLPPPAAAALVALAERAAAHRLGVPALLEALGRGAAAPRQAALAALAGVGADAEPFRVLERLAEWAPGAALLEALGAGGAPFVRRLGACGSLPNLLTAADWRAVLPWAAGAALDADGLAALLGQLRWRRAVTPLRAATLDAWLHTYASLAPPQRRRALAAAGDVASSWPYGAGCCLEILVGLGPDAGDPGAAARLQARARALPPAPLPPGALLRWPLGALDEATWQPLQQLWCALGRPPADAGELAAWAPVLAWLLEAAPPVLDTGADACAGLAAAAGLDPRARALVALPWSAAALSTLAAVPAGLRTAPLAGALRALAGWLGAAPSPEGRPARLAAALQEAVGAAALAAPARRALLAAVAAGGRPWGRSCQADGLLDAALCLEGGAPPAAAAGRALAALAEGAGAALVAEGLPAARALVRALPAAGARLEAWWRRRPGAAQRFGHERCSLEALAVLASVGGADAEAVFHAAGGLAPGALTFDAARAARLRQVVAQGPAALAAARDAGRLLGDSLHPALATLAAILTPLAAAARAAALASLRRLLQLPAPAAAPVAAALEAASRLVAATPGAPLAALRVAAQGRDPAALGRLAEALEHPDVDAVACIEDLDTWLAGNVCVPACLVGPTGVAAAELPAAPRRAVLAAVRRRCAARPPPWDEVVAAVAAVADMAGAGAATAAAEPLADAALALWAAAAPRLPLPLCLEMAAGCGPRRVRAALSPGAAAPRPLVALQQALWDAGDGDVAAVAAADGAATADSAAVDSAARWARGRQREQAIAALARCGGSATRSHPLAAEAALSLKLDALALAWSQQRGPMALRRALAAEAARAAGGPLAGAAAAATLAAALGPWDGRGPLPAAVRRALPLCAPSPAALVALLGQMPGGPPSPRLRLALLDAVLGAASPAPRPPPEGPFDCAICLAPRPAAARAVPPAGCSCATAGCRGCAADALRADLQNGRCPTLCGAPLDRQDLECAGLADDDVGRLLGRWVRARLGALPHWRWCATPDCLGGHTAAPRALVTLDCGLCGVATLHAGPDAFDVGVAQRLLAGVEASPAANGEGVMRECYHCGAGAEKDAQCMAVRCHRGDRLPYDFFRGPQVTASHRYLFDGVPAQAYRPLEDGMLAQLGLYRGLPRGVLSAADQGVVRQRAAALRRRCAGATNAAQMLAAAGAVD